MSFKNIFKGRRDAYGKFTVSVKEGAQPGDKVNGQASTVHGKLTSVEYDKHLSGEQGLGVIPINKSSKCWWGAIDVDDYKLDLADLDKKVQDTPFVLCRTKSGGAHLYIFFKEAQPAKKVRQKLFEFACYILYPDSELFPKQDKIDSEKDIGNWINMPYFDAENTTRYAIHKNKQLSLDEFYELVEKKTISTEELETFDIPLDTNFDDAPPCLQYIATAGVTTLKDLTLYNFAVFFKKKFPDNWEDQLEDFNHKTVNPPAKSSTIQQVIKPHRKKDFFYKCKENPLIGFCNKNICHSREFGIGHDGAPDVLMGNLTKVETNPPMWYLDIDGHRIGFETQDLLDQKRFRKKCFEIIHKIPRQLKQMTWDKLLQDMLDTVETIEAPEDASPEGQFYCKLRSFCLERATAHSEDEILQNKPWTDEGRTYFRSSDLMTFLSNQKFYDFKAPRIYTLIRDMDGKKHIKTLKGRTTRLWSIPEYENKQEEDFDIPLMDEGDF